jgi:glycosyltransferase involved in cell wall biosynthesis
MLNATVLQALILTKNEEPNIKRVLERLTWLEKVVVLDSFSTDTTLDIVAEYKNTTVVQRSFDTHGQQWNYGLDQLNSEWVLSLDADYVLTDKFIEETEAYVISGDKSAYLTNFSFLVFGKPLLKDNTTPRPVLFKRKDCRYFDDGHTQRLKIEGSTGMYKSFILHDDRKSLSRWLSNQDGYAIKEANKW